jgi:hypothetical protein
VQTVRRFLKIIQHDYDPLELERRAKAKEAAARIAQVVCTAHVIWTSFLSSRLFEENNDRFLIESNVIFSSDGYHHAGECSCSSGSSTNRSRRRYLL